MVFCTMRLPKVQIGRPPKRRKITALVLLASSTGLSVWMMADFATGSSGYVAGYTNAGALLFAFVFGLVGLVLLVWRKTRWTRAVTMGCGAWLIASYLVGVNTLYRLDTVAWKGQRMV